MGFTLPGVTYEILVVDLSMPERRLDGRELRSFYSQVCIDLVAAWEAAEVLRATISSARKVCLVAFGRPMAALAL
jgi:hypothetical protein